MSGTEGVGFNTHTHTHTCTCVTQHACSVFTPRTTSKRIRLSQCHQYNRQSKTEDQYTKKRMFSYLDHWSVYQTLYSVVLPMVGSTTLVLGAAKCPYRDKVSPQYFFDRNAVAERHVYPASRDVLKQSNTPSVCIVHGVSVL